MFGHDPCLLYSYSFNNVKKKLISDCNAAWLVEEDTDSGITTIAGNGFESGKGSVKEKTGSVKDETVNENSETGNEKNGKGSNHSSIRSTGFVLLPHQQSMDSSLRINMK